MLDAVTYLTEFENMCRSYPDCIGCPLEFPCGGCSRPSDPVKQVAIVENWLFRRFRSSQVLITLGGRHVSY